MTRRCAARRSTKQSSVRTERARSLDRSGGARAIGVTQTRAYRLRAGATVAASLVALAAALAFVLTGAAFSSTSSIEAEPRAQPKRTPQPASTLQGTGVLRLGSKFSAASGYERFSYVIVGLPGARPAARLPGTSLVYMTGTSVPSAWFAGVSYATARKNDWLLKDAGGAYVMNEQYGHVIGDFGAPAYQRRFIENVIAFLKRNKLDGVFLDEVIAYPGSFTNGRLPAKYPTPEAWEDAMVSFVSAVGKALGARGSYLLVNPQKFVSRDVRSDTGEHTAAFWQRIAPHVDGLLSEYWLQNHLQLGQLRAVGTNWYEYWSGWQSLVSVAQRAGADFFGLMYGASGDTRAMRYGRANFLLDWNGRGGAFIFEATDRADPYHPAWVKQLGRPAAPKLERAPGVWQRRYEKGIVVVNATNAPVTLRVGGHLQTLGPTDGLFTRLPRR